jgi:hypothetical protein
LAPQSLALVVGPELEYLLTFVQEMLMRPLTPVSQPHFVMGWFVSKQGHSTRVATQHQTLHNQWHLVQLYSPIDLPNCC